MPNADKVQPGRWSSINVLFDNGWYSIISGKYDGEEALGERWNGSGNDIGFPNTRGYAQWHVVPDFLNVPILQGALEEIRRNPYAGSEDHKKRLVTHLSGCYLDY